MGTPGRWRRLAASMALVWCLAFAVLHLFWAAGGSLGLATSAGRDLATRRPTSFVVLGLYGVAVLCLLGAALVIAVMASRPSRRRRFATWLAIAVGAVPLFRGVALQVVLAAGIGDLRQQVGPSEAHWSLVLWNPWFVLGGALFLVVGVSSRSARCATGPG